MPRAIMRKKEKKNKRIKKRYVDVLMANFIIDHEQKKKKRVDKKKYTDVLNLLS